MDLNHIKLPASVIADLYKKSIVDPIQNFSPVQQEKFTPEIVSDNSSWKSLGNNNKNILIVVNIPETVYLPDDDLNFLTGILGACKLSLNDVAIVNLNNHPDASYKELISFFKSKIVFLFAVEPTNFGLPLNFPHYQVQSFANTSFLFSPSLKELEDDKLQKSKLWVCLRRLFGV